MSFEICKLSVDGFLLDYEADKLLEYLAYIYSVPIPCYFIYEAINEESFFIYFYDEGFKDFNGIIILARYGGVVWRDMVVHEFFHYLDYISGSEMNEDFTDERTDEYLNNEIGGWQILKNYSSDFFNT